MHVPQVIKLAFDPKTASSEVKEILGKRTSQILWCAIKNSHITDQFFNQDVLSVAKTIDEGRIHTYSEFEKAIHPLSRKFGRVPVYSTTLQYEDRIDNEFWGEILMILNGQRSFKYEIVVKEPEVTLKKKPELSQQDAKKCSCCGRDLYLYCSVCDGSVRRY